MLEERVGYRPTWAEVSLANIAHNFSLVRARLRPGIKVMATVKADAYGHGLLPVAQKLVSCGAEYLGVASIDEGIRLRNAGIRTPILVLGGVLPGDAKAVLEYGLAVTVYSIDLAQALSRCALSAGRTADVHVKVDTGMARLGVPPDSAFSLVRRLKGIKGVRLEGLFTHFAFADMSREFTEYQLKLFRQLVERLSAAGIQIPLVHAANSMGLLKYAHSHFTMVRPGLILYGVYPGEGLSLSIRPALSLKSRVIYRKRVGRGQGISYGHTYKTASATTIVTLPIGYGDGYPRNLSNSGPVIIHGRRLRISGNVCMDQMMVDVGTLPVRIGDPVVLIGSQKSSRVSAEELAQLCGTIPYEILCGIGNRVPRVYLE